ncbi:MAG TPA: hypothetical protein VKB32_02960 [Actinomycetota bacterium]|nr:hypothetical protein [Actinomycetota bacterium]
MRLRAAVEHPKRPRPRDTPTTPALIVLLVLAYGAGLFATTTAIRPSDATHSPLSFPPILIATLRGTPPVRTRGR